MSLPPRYLFSIDLEEFEVLHPRPNFRRTSLPQLTKLFLDFLKNARMVTTFFILGKVARAYPELIAAIFEEGHELACHTDQHDTLDTLNPAQFRTDLERNREALLTAVPTAQVKGFRAPLLSLTAQTSWAYDILTDLGFTYSSSVLPARSPLFGWPEFGRIPRQIQGVWELPVTLGSGWFRALPFAAGTYFRCLPEKLLFKEFASVRKMPTPVVGYLHPYDVDTHQEYVLHKNMRRTPHLNPLLYWGRRKAIPRLRALIENGFIFGRYDHYLSEIHAGHDPSKSFSK